MVSTDGKLTELNAVRGLAAGVVFAGHFFANFLPHEQAALDGSPFYFLFNGPAAVILFFVLSGFVLTLRPIERGRFAGLLIPMLKRWPRLAGTVVAASLGYILAALTGAFPHPEYVISKVPVNPPAILTWGWGRQADQVGDVLREATAGTFFFGTARHNDVLWTMHWELLGSFLSFALAAVLMLPVPLRLRVLIFLALTAGTAAYSPYLPCFAAGVAGAAFHTKGVARLRLPGWLAGGLTSCALVLLSWNILNPVGLWAWAASLEEGTRLVLWVALQTLAAVMVIGVTLYNGTARYWLSGSAGAWAGRLSFPLYLVHILVLCSFTAWAYLLLAPNGLGLAAGVGLFLATTLVVLVVAYPIMQFDEWWVDRLGRLTKRGRSANLQAVPEPI